MLKIENLASGHSTNSKSFLVKDIVKISSTDGSNTFCIMPKTFVELDMQRIKDMKIYEDDIWVVTFPKCGTTWTQEMIWMLNNNLDYETASKVKLDQRFPFLEVESISKKFESNVFEAIRNHPRPRYIKSHLPKFLLPDQLWTVKPKIIYVTRNPKDVAVSFYHHYCNVLLYEGPKCDFIRIFSTDLTFRSPMNKHVLGFWNLRNESNILFLFYEDMKRDLKSEIRRAMNFLGKKYSQVQIDKLSRHLSFESFQKNDMVNKNDIIKKIGAGSNSNFNFIRKGQVGGYKMELSNEEEKILDDMLVDPELSKSGFEYKFA